MRDSNRLFKLAIAALVIVASAGSAVRADIELPQGTEVDIAFSQDVSSKYVAPGDLVPIHTTAPITFGGFTVVREGAPGTARVKSVEPAGRGGKAGKLEIELVDLDPAGFYEAEGDQRIMLKAVDPIKAEGKGKKLLSYLFIFGLFIKGGQAEIPADTVYKAVVADNIVILMD